MVILSLIKASIQIESNDVNTGKQIWYLVTCSKDFEIHGTLIVY